jgi:hypothetical protein
VYELKGFICNTQVSAQVLALQISKFGTDSSKTVREGNGVRRVECQPQLFLEPNGEMKEKGNLSTELPNKPHGLLASKAAIMQDIQLF